MLPSHAHRQVARLLVLTTGIMAAILAYVVAAVGDFGLGPLGFVPALVISICSVSAVTRSFPPRPLGIIVTIVLAMIIWISYIWTGLVLSGSLD